MTTKRKQSQDDERDFLAEYDASVFPSLSVTVDVAIITATGGELRALLVQRDEHPDRGKWALPGGFVGVAEALDDAATRVLAAKGGLEDVYLEQLYSFGAPRRDPRTRVITVAYYALVHPARLAAVAGASSSVRLATVAMRPANATGESLTVRDGTQALALAFDHTEILAAVVKRLRGKLDYAALGFELLPKHFTLRMLQEVHETILGVSLNKDSFRRRQLADRRVKPTGRRESEVGHRPAELYRFN